MCGIVGGTSNRNILPILVEGLRRLEYRGYDSAGVAYKTNGKISLVKNAGRVEDLAEKLNLKKNNAKIGIAHTRWATHGVPSEKNAHPHSSKNNIYVVHNGIIENHIALKETLKKEGFKFSSQTDTEVIAHLIQFYMDKGKDLDSAVISTIAKLKGAYALGILDKNNPDTLIGVRQQSPLVIGEGFDEQFIASDIMALSNITNKFKFMDDGQIAILDKDHITVTSSSGVAAKLKTQEVDSNAYTNDLKGYNHFMEKEIFEQSDVIKDALEGRLTKNESQEGIFGVGFEKEMKNITNIQVVACGTSFHAGRIFEFWSHKFLGINCRVDYGSEYQYQEPIKTDKTLLVTISQSGETADTLSSLKFAKKSGEPVTLTICNVANSSLCRESDYALLTKAGPEIGVASTKAFTTQMTVLYMMAVKLSKSKGIISEKLFHKYLLDISNIDKKVHQALSSNNEIKKIAKKFLSSKNFLYLGRGYNFPIALEGALKLKEISYIHAEGYPAAEMKHGPIALIDKDMPTVVIATNKINYDKVVSNIQEIKSRKGKIIAVVSKGDVEVKKIADYIIEVPDSIESITPFITVIPLQLLSYHIAVMLGKDVDQPRNLAKSVTVE